VVRSPSRLHLSRAVLQWVTCIPNLFMCLLARHSRSDNKILAYLISLKKKTDILCETRVPSPLSSRERLQRNSRVPLFRKRNLRVIIAASNISTRDKPFTWLIETGISQAYGTLLFFSERLAAASRILGGLQKPHYFLKL